MKNINSVQFDYVLLLFNIQIKYNIPRKLKFPVMQQLTHSNRVKVYQLCYVFSHLTAEIRD